MQLVPKEPETVILPGVFCDWLSIYQVHPNGGLPIILDGRVRFTDADGVIKLDIAQKLVHKGSFETSLRLCCDGNRVTFEGNIGRFNRQDNLFGYGVRDCISLANTVLAGFGLPPFTDPKPMALNGPSGSDKGFQAVGAVITRIDLTRNYLTGSATNAPQVIRYLQGFRSGKFEPRPYRTTGVSWGEGSKWFYAKVYDKAADYIRHLSESNTDHDPVLFAWMKENGVVRHEITLKSRWLKQKGFWRFSLWDQTMESRIYAMFGDVIVDSAHVDEYLEIPGRAGELALAWRDGADLRTRLSQGTYYKYKKVLLGFGIDISIPANVTRLNTRLEVIQLVPCEIPQWYALPRVA